jgi:hypothetical protein
MCSDIGAIIDYSRLLADTLPYPAASGVGAALMLVAADCGGCHGVRQRVSVNVGIGGHA